jgi:hypothetical protein
VKALLRPERPFASRAEALHDMTRLAREGAPVTSDEGPAYCVDPPGRDILATPAEVDAADCADCKKQSLRAARKALDEGHQVDLAFSNTGRPQEHMWIRIDGVPVDPAVAAGMPPPPADVYRGGVIVSMNSQHWAATHTAAGSSSPGGFDQFLQAATGAVHARFPWIQLLSLQRAAAGLAMAQTSGFGPSPEAVAVVQIATSSAGGAMTGDQVKREMRRGQNALQLVDGNRANLDSWLWAADGSPIPPWKQGQHAGEQGLERLSLWVAAEAHGAVHERKRRLGGQQQQRGGGPGLQPPQAPPPAWRPAGYDRRSYPRGELDERAREDDRNRRQAAQQRPMPRPAPSFFDDPMATGAFLAPQPVPVAYPVPAYPVAPVYAPPPAYAPAPAPVYAPPTYAPSSAQQGQYGQGQAEPQSEEDVVAEAALLGGLLGGMIGASGGFDAGDDGGGGSAGADDDDPLASYLRPVG